MPTPWTLRSLRSGKTLKHAFKAAFRPTMVSVTATSRAILAAIPMPVSAAPTHSALHFNESNRKPCPLAPTSRTSSLPRAFSQLTARQGLHKHCPAYDRHRHSHCHGDYNRHTIQILSLGPQSTGAALSKDRRGAGCSASPTVLWCGCALSACAHISFSKGATYKARRRHRHRLHPQ